ncbi:pentatricopeptide repeat-containing protein At4g18975, chloroplastic-like isoform X2 [Zingiber officinale]|uniref:pentatricopeptide repeat-containing protein At4g18975, chloroplastic-like isoform X2 n=1 Tax=Zingiber officinale TaxID=94328 RepID=UPI001C4DD2A6|nr:pentatricopeptide repeat-containing protein At4g18975, chloroplastic-like isoform X2 [Zingiber officinale]
MDLTSMGEIGMRGDLFYTPRSRSLPFFSASFAAKIIVSQSVRHSRRDPSLKIKRVSKREHHLWMKRDSAGSGQKALNLVHTIEKLPNEKEVIYCMLDKWSAFETEFPVIAAAKALEILRRRRKWLRIIQVTKWLFSKGQVLTMGTFDTLLLAFDMDGRVDEAESVWKIILQTSTRSVSKKLFSRMIALYDHHHHPDKILEVFADMEELGVTPDNDSVTRIGRAFEMLGQNDKRDLLFKRYKSNWRYLHFNGEHVRVRSTETYN